MTWKGLGSYQCSSVQKIKQLRLVIIVLSIGAITSIAFLSHSYVNNSKNPIVIVNISRYNSSNGILHQSAVFGRSPATKTASNSPEIKSATNDPEVKVSSNSTTSATSTGSPEPKITTGGPNTSTATASPVTEAATTSPGTNTARVSPVTKAATTSPETKHSTGRHETKITTGVRETDSERVSPVPEAATASPEIKTATGGPSTNTATASPVTKATTASPEIKTTTGGPGTNTANASPVTKATTGNLETKAATASPETTTTTGGPAPNTATGVTKTETVTSMAETQTIKYDPYIANTTKATTMLCSSAFKSRHLVGATLIGRTGNQLFQLFTLLATAEDFCCTPVVRKEELSSIFFIRNIVRRDFNDSTFRSIGERGWSIYNGKILENQTLNVNWAITGYRQSYKYFQHRQTLVRSSITFKENITLDVLHFLANSSFQRKTKVGLHVRRGDFSQEIYMKLGYNSSSLEFISRAFSYFDKLLGNLDTVYIVASDDIKWCKENIKFNNTYYSPFKDVGRDLNLLTQCDHNIVTAGSFGWMSAWLNETGTVVYDKSFPRRDSWLAKGFGSYYPEWWVGL